MGGRKRGVPYREYSRRKSIKQFLIAQFRTKPLLKTVENDNEFIRATNQILITNWTVLKKLMLSQRKTITVSKARLEDLGFCFDYYTSVTIHKNIIVYHCYDIKYFSIEEGKYTIPKLPK